VAVRASGASQRRPLPLIEAQPAGECGSLLEATVVTCKERTPQGDGPHSDRVLVAYEKVR